MHLHNYSKCKNCQVLIVLEIRGSKSNLENEMKPTDLLIKH